MGKWVLIFFKIQLKIKKYKQFFERKMRVFKMKKNDKLKAFLEVKKVVKKQPFFESKF